jgi:heparinase II/III-like protein
VMHWPKGRLIVFCACYVFPAMVFVSIWFPLIAHYYVPNIVITKEMVDSARRDPSDSVLYEIEGFFKSYRIKNSKNLITSAEMVLQGQVTIHGSISSAIGFPFDADDLDKGLPGGQLFIASFSIPDLLLSAYEVTGRDDFLIAAKDVILGFASYERNAWLPKGLLWNDHAIAGRISVMAKFWKLYRTFTDYQSDVARDLFQLVTRSAQLLAKPSHFTFSTNHGIMQNLALWQICLAFPTLPKIEFYKQLALERMKDQMHFYVNEEGVILEHSAGYQKAGLKFIGMAFKYLTLLDISIPEDLKEKYQKAEYFYTQLLRPNGSLPMFGDTGSGGRAPGKLGRNEDGNDKDEGQERNRSWLSKRPHSLYPVAGYSIWWNGLHEWPKEDKLSQTVVAWSYFPGFAHKHADEMSVLLWAKGHNWWTNVGYWPYGTKGRAEAVSWAGSNAPHLTNESNHSIRQTRLISYGWSDGLATIDLERKGTDEYIARRQIIQIKPNLWIVIDHTFGKEDQQTTTTWTTSHNINLRKSELSGSYILKTEGSNAKFTKFILTSEGAKIRQFKGSLSPFAGWESHRPAHAIVVEQPANDSWAAVIWLLQKQGEESQKFNGTPFMKYWKNPENWRIGFPLAFGLMNIWRENDRVFVKEDAKGNNIRKELQLSKPPQISEKIKDIQLAYKNVARKYSTKRYSMNRHLKATYLIVFVFLMQEVFFLVYKKTGRKYFATLKGISCVGWIAVAAWLYQVYL